MRGSSLHQVKKAGDYNVRGGGGGWGGLSEPDFPIAYQNNKKRSSKAHHADHVNHNLP
jgi:hypothetical protein